MKNMKTRKKIYGGLLMAAAALLCLTGCKKDEEGEKIMLGTQFEKAVSAQKTCLGEGNTVCWSAGDKVNVNGTEYTVSADGSVAVAENDNYYAVYPYEGSSADINSGTVTVPATQPYTLENGKQVLNGPMAARLDASSGILYFKNLYSLLKVTVSADDKDFTVNTITVTATGANARALAGSYTFTFNGATTEDPNTAPTVGDIASGSSKVTLINIAVKMSAGEDKDFYLAVHPFATQNLTVKVSGMLGGKSAIYTHTTATTIGLSRSRIGGLGINLQQLEPIMGGIGVFSINAQGDLVSFSPGNLQWSATNGGTTPTTHKVAGDGTADGTWRFAEHQWDYVGDATNGTVYAGSVKCDNASIASDYTGWIDLFGWGTSGWTETGKWVYPYKISTNYEEYGRYRLEESIAGTSYDWGVYNLIGSDPAGTWRTLTGFEGTYLLGTSGSTRGGKHTDWWIYNMVTITAADGTNDVSGLIVYPDGVTEKPAGVTANLGRANTGCVAISKADFDALEAAGCVFLPAAGYRHGTSIYIANSYGNYWSSSYGNGNNIACYLHFYNGYVGPSYYLNRPIGRSVRLVKDVE